MLRICTARGANGSNRHLLHPSLTYIHTYLNGVVDELRYGVWYFAEVCISSFGDGVEVRLVRNFQLHVALESGRNTFNIVTITEWWEHKSVL